jgi:NAD(P)-dependent dehydrogenase (short-subunit alcohol dehydrogenase family)
VDLTGQSIVVTGTSNGIGIPTALALARANATVLCLVRNADKMREVIKDSGVDEATAKRMCIHTVSLDDLESVAKCAESISREHDRVDGVMCNAGVMFPSEFTLTKQGFEYHFGINFLAHFALVQLLDPLMSGAPKESTKRMVITSSAADRWASGINFDDLQLKKEGAYTKMLAYAQSSLARSLFAKEFDRRNSARGWNGFATHPGIIMTGLQTEFTKQDYTDLGMVDEDGNLSEFMVEHLIKTPEAGAATQLWGLVSPELEGKGGSFLQDCQVTPAWDGEMMNPGYNPLMMDEPLGIKLWDEAAALVKPHIG